MEEDLAGVEWVLQEEEVEGRRLVLEGGLVVEVREEEVEDHHLEAEGAEVDIEEASGEEEVEEDTVVEEEEEEDTLPILTTKLLTYYTMVKSKK